MPDEKERIVVVQFSVVDASPDARQKLFALRNIMHRVLNAAISEWHRAERRPSTKDGDKETRDRGQVTEAVKQLLSRESAYWEKRVIDLTESEVSLRRRLEYAKGMKKEVGDLARQHEAIVKQLGAAACRASISVPSAISDSAVRFTQGKYDEYQKTAFRGERASPTFRDGQPIRWRDGAWTIAPGEKSGSYAITVPVHKNGSRLEHAVLRVIPDGPSMYGWAKKMVDDEAVASGAVKRCDARLVYSERKKQWFAKLTIKVRYAPPAAGLGVAAMRRGVHNAFTLAFEGGDCRLISGGSVVAFKRKIKARKESVGRHLRSLELGKGARGHGQKRRFAALKKIDDAEARFVDNRCKTWAANICKILKAHGVGHLLVAKVGDREFSNAIDSDVLRAFLYQFPFAKAYDCLRRALEYAGIAVEEKAVGLNARRCPSCLHEHESKQVGELFTCEVCAVKRPSDSIIAWNMLIDEVGGAPIKKAAAAKKKVGQMLRKTKEDADASH